MTEVFNVSRRTDKYVDSSRTSFAGLENDACKALASFLNDRIIRTETSKAVAYFSEEWAVDLNRFDLFKPLLYKK
jgi:hypothetical protein